MMIHSADFNGGAKVFETSRIWSELVNREFIAQYKEEQECNLTPTIYMKDLDKISNVAKQEIGFFKIIVKPLWMSLS